MNEVTLPSFGIHSLIFWPPQFHSVDEIQPDFVAPTSFCGMAWFSGTHFILCHGLIFWHPLHSVAWHDFLAPTSFRGMAWFSGTHFNLCHDLIFWHPLHFWGMAWFSGTHFTPWYTVRNSGTHFNLSVRYTAWFLAPTSFCGMAWFS